MWPLPVFSEYMCKSLVFLEFFFHMINCLFTFFFIWSEGFLFVCFCFVFWNSRLFTATIHKKEIERTFSGEREKTKKIFLFQKRIEIVGGKFSLFLQFSVTRRAYVFQSYCWQIGRSGQHIEGLKKQQQMNKVFMKDKRKFKMKLFFVKLAYLLLDVQPYQIRLWFPSGI